MTPRRTRPAELLVVGAVLLGLSGGPAASAQSPPDWAGYVDPLIGTAPAPSAAYGQEFDGGDVFPGAVYPAGMLAWSPDTVEHTIPGGYFYPDHTLKGFSLTHFSGRGCTVYQDLPISAINGSLDVSPRSQPTAMQSTFSHANETAAPGRYAVNLDNGIQVELTATPRTGLGRVTFPAEQPSQPATFPSGQPAEAATAPVGRTARVGTLVVDAGGSVNGVFDSQVLIDPVRQVVTGQLVSQVGCGLERYTLYFAIAFDQPFAGYGTWAEDALWPGSTSARAGHAGAYVSFDTSEQQQVRLKPAISYVSVDNAIDNLDAEDPGWDVAAVQAAARTSWNATLGRVEASGGSQQQLVTFYTALYHSFLHPNLFSDANGEYVGFDDRVHHVAAGHAHYHNIPGWDEYRSLIQLRAMLAPEQTSDIIQSLVDDALQGGGGMPRWEQANRNSAGMVGDSPGVYVANAYAFGARDFDATAALQALDLGASAVGTQSGGHPVREWLEPWVSRGYVPNQPSITLEYATDDFGIAQLARAVGDAARYDTYLSRSANWVNTFNPASGYVESRDAGGGFPNADHSHACCGFVEGNAAQYTWMVPFDYAGLFARLGGNAAAIARLDAFFGELNAGQDRPHAWIGNEPSLNAPWAYDFAGAPARTQAVVSRIRAELFDATPGGLPGNDDGGTTSAWYVLSALGLYPAVPGVGGVAVGSPLFEDTLVHLGGDRALHIMARGVADDAPYVQSLLVDSAAYQSAWIDWARLSAGATLDFSLGTSPTAWASAP